jgi:hypothetical protein
MPIAAVVSVQQLERGDLWLKKPLVRNHYFYYLFYMEEMESEVDDFTDIPGNRSTAVHMCVQCKSRDTKRNRPVRPERLMLRNSEPSHHLLQG